MNVYKQVCLHGGPTSWSYIMPISGMFQVHNIGQYCTSTVFNCNSYVAITLQDD